MVITKEIFIEIMDEVKNAYNYQEDLNKLFKKHEVDGYIYQPDCVCSVLKLLHMYFGEKDLDEWISYFCFELDFGKKYKDGMVLDADGKNIPLATYDDLYDLLTN